MTALIDMALEQLCLWQLGGKHLEFGIMFTIGILILEGEKWYASRPHKIIGHNTLLFCVYTRIICRYKLFTKLL